MAVVTVKSATITNRDAVPAVLNNAAVQHGLLRELIGHVTVTNGDSIASKFIMSEVPSNARVTQMLLRCGAITSGTADIGVYRNTRDGGAVVDVDLFASAQSIATALAVDTDVLQESAEYTIAEQIMPLWQALGLTADPNVTYDIVVTLTAAATATAGLLLKTRYVV